MLYPPELRARIVFNDIRGRFLHAIDRSTLSDTTVAISVVPDHHLHYMFGQHRDQLSTLNWLLIIYLQRTDRSILTQVRVSECSLMRVQSWSPRSTERKSITHVSGTFCYYISGRSTLSGIRQESVDR